MDKLKKRKQFSPREFRINRESIVESPKILLPKEEFFFEDGFYSNEDETIILRTSFSFGKIFKPV